MASNKQFFVVHIPARSASPLMDISIGEEPPQSIMQLPSPEAHLHSAVGCDMVNKLKRSSPDLFNWFLKLLGKAMKGKNSKARTQIIETNIQKLMQKELTAPAFIQAVGEALGCVVPADVESRLGLHLVVFTILCQGLD